MIIREEQLEDQSTVNHLVREAFWNIYRPGCDEHAVLHQMRHHPDFEPRLNLVAQIDEEIVGQIAYVQAGFHGDDGNIHKFIMFGPVAVRPDHQRKGIGSKLIESSLQRAESLGYTAVAIMGNPDFYHRFGFVSASGLGVFQPNVDRNDPADYFMIRTSKPWEWGSGTILLPDCYFVNPEFLIEFERSFPAKAALRLPGQIF